MKVKDLIEDLQRLDPDMKVVLSSDGGGNNFKPLDGYEISTYDPESRDIFLPELTEELKQKGYSDEDVRSDLPKVVVLWPCW